MTDTILVFVQLLEEGTPTARGTQAVPLGDDKYKLLPTPHYDPEDEIWEFLPDSIVRCERVTNFGKEIILAIEQIDDSA